MLGHEKMGEVVEVGADNTKLKVGDRVVVPFTIACGECFFCKRGSFSGCERSNPRTRRRPRRCGATRRPACSATRTFSAAIPAARPNICACPYADVGPIKVPDGLSDEQVLFLSDIFPTGYMAADFCDIQPGDTIAIWGCGPVGQMAIRSAFLLGAERVIAIDTVPERLALARAAGADDDRFPRRGRLRPHPGADQGPRRRRLHRCGRHRGRHASASFYAMVDRVKVATFMGTDRPHVLRQAIHCCRNFGTVSIVGVYGGFLDKIPLGSAINRGLTFRMAQTPVQRYLPKLLELDRERRDRPVLRHHPHGEPRRGPGPLQDVQRQEGRLHQSRPQAGMTVRSKALWPA